MTIETHLNSHSSSFFERVSNFGPEVNAFSGWYISAIFKNIVLISNPVFCFFLRLVLSDNKVSKASYLCKFHIVCQKGSFLYFVQLMKIRTEFFFQLISRTETIMKQSVLPVLKIGYHLVTICPHVTATYCTRVVAESLKLCLVGTALKILPQGISRDIGIKRNLKILIALYC